MNGYALIHRSLIGNPQFRGKDDEYSAVWIILHACWQDTTVRINRKPVSLKRGELCYATSYLAKAWECSKTSAHARLQHFKKHGFIRTEERTGELIISVCNYEQYQGNTNDTRTEDRTPDGTTPERAPNDARTNKNTSNPDNPLNAAKTPVVSRETLEDFFAMFWAIYPTGRKTAKPKALEKFISLVRGGVDPQAIIGGAKRYAGAGYDGSKFVAGPLVWLNQGRWTDEDIPTPSDKPKQQSAAKRRSGIYDALRDELAGDAAGAGGLDGIDAADGPGKNAAAIDDADIGDDDEASGREGVCGGDGEASVVVVDDGDRDGRSGSNAAVPDDYRGLASRSPANGYWKNDSNPPIPLVAEAGAHPGARSGGIGEAPERADHSTGGDGSDPFDIPDFLRRKAS